MARLRCGSRSPRTSTRMSILLRYPTSTCQRSFPALCTPIRRSTPHAPDPNDVAVITFETPVDGITPAVLPTLGLLDELGQQNGLKDQLFTVVGYGVNQRIVGEGPKTLSEGSEPAIRDFWPQRARAGIATSVDEQGKRLWRARMPLTLAAASFWANRTHLSQLSD